MGICEVALVRGKVPKTCHILHWASENNQGWWKQWDGSGKELQGSTFSIVWRPGQVKLLVWQLDFGKVFLLMICSQHCIQNSWTNKDLDLSSLLHPASTCSFSSVSVLCHTVELISYLCIQHVCILIWHFWYWIMFYPMCDLSIEWQLDRGSLLYTLLGRDQGEHFTKGLWAQNPNLRKNMLFFCEK